MIASVYISISTVTQSAATFELSLKAQALAHGNSRFEVESEKWTWKPLLIGLCSKTPCLWPSALALRQQFPNTKPTIEHTAQN